MTPWASGEARPERHTGQRGKEDSFSVQNHHPNRVWPGQEGQREN